KLRLKAARAGLILLSHFPPSQMRISPLPADFRFEIDLQRRESGNLNRSVKFWGGSSFLLLYQRSTVNGQLSTVNCQLSTVNCQLSTVNCRISFFFGS
ncbi:MAG: hypothetical protein JGK08_08960, partial [Microcoleus sp. PH2017_04_SCI_O_A]|nr:hypothetical protein [Microcoleus sp. PH2017_04_SCI_O_A]